MNSVACERLDFSAVPQRDCTGLMVLTAFPDVWCLLTHWRTRHLGGICGLVDSFVSNVEIQVVHPLHHPPLGLVPHLGRLLDGDTCRENAARKSGTTADVCSVSLQSTKPLFRQVCRWRWFSLHRHCSTEEYSHDGTMNCGSVFPAYPSLV